MKFYWRLPDGRTWGGAENCFVEKTFSGKEKQVSYAKDMRNLKEYIAFYNAHMKNINNLDELQNVYEAAIQKRLDDWAMTRGYAGIVSACTYATDTSPRFQAEGQRAVELRGSTWLKGYAILADFYALKRPLPLIEEVLAELPELTWLDE